MVFGEPLLNNNSIWMGIFLIMMELEKLFLNNYGIQRTILNNCYFWWTIDFGDS